MLDLIVTLLVIILGLILLVVFFVLFKITSITEDKNPLVINSKEAKEEANVWVEGMNENYLDWNNPNLKLAGARAAMKRTSLAMIQMYDPNYTQEEYNSERKRLGL